MKGCYIVWIVHQENIEAQEIELKISNYSLVHPPGTKTQAFNMPWPMILYRWVDAFCTYWSHFKDGGNKLLFDSFFVLLMLMWLGLQLVTTITLDKKVQYFKMSPLAFLYVLLFAIQLQFYSTNKYISLSFNGYYCASTKTHLQCA